MYWKNSEDSEVKEGHHTKCSYWVKDKVKLKCLKLIYEVKIYDWIKSKCSPSHLLTEGNLYMFWAKMTNKITFPFGLVCAMTTVKLGWFSTFKFHMSTEGWLITITFSTVSALIRFWVEFLFHILLSRQVSDGWTTIKRVLDSGICKV